MKPAILVKLYDMHNDKVAELETLNSSEIVAFLKNTEFVYGVVRVTYEDNYYNEATFKNQTQCKLLVTLFREKPLLEYIYSKEF